MLADSGEMLLDAYAKKYDLKKKTRNTSKDKQLRKEGRGLSLEYGTKDGQPVLRLWKADGKASSETYYSTELFVYSTRKNSSFANSPKMLGRMVFITSNTFISLVPIMGKTMGDPATIAANPYECLQNSRIVCRQEMHYPRNIRNSITTIANRNTKMEIRFMPCMSPILVL